MIHIFDLFLNIKKRQKHTILLKLKNTINALLYIDKSQAYIGKLNKQPGYSQIQFYFSCTAPYKMLFFSLCQSSERARGQRKRENRFTSRQPS